MKFILFFIKYSWRYLRYYWRAHTRFDVHSPFVSAFIEETIEDRRRFYIFDTIRVLMERLEVNDDLVDVIDYGAGSQLGVRKQSPVNTLAGNSSISPAAGRLLFRIVRFLQPGNFLELGTCLGVSAIYQVKACPKGSMISIEGNPEIAELARKNVQALAPGRIEVKTGPFREVLPKVMATTRSVDFFHFDGDHRYQPTIEYFEQCLQISNPKSVFCISDIYWSAEMEKAWQYLKKHPKVRLSIDLFHFGLLFLRPEHKQKEDFTLIAAHLKPWRMGFFR